MCGIAGWSGLSQQEKATKLFLTHALARGIDGRGGHGAGFVSIRNQTVSTKKNVGKWSKAPKDFLISACQSDLLLMHSRWATCGERNEIKQAHPFTILRDQTPILYGVHNGIVDSWDSAKEHGRTIEVDSEEIFHLIADKEYDRLASLSGYGVAMWVMANEARIKLARLSDNGEIVVAQLDSGGYVWASTWDILSFGLRAANLKAKWILNTEKVGQVFHIYKDKIATSSEKVRLLKETSYWGRWRS